MPTCNFSFFPFQQTGQLRSVLFWSPQEISLKFTQMNGGRARDPVACAITESHEHSGFSIATSEKLLQVNAFI